MDSKPLVNILTRTSGRPKYFKNCINSIKKQTYSNINHIVSIDDDKSEEYVKKYTNNYIRVKKYEGKIPLLDKETGARRAAPYNLYLNDLRNEVKDGWIMFLDDDDMFLEDNAIEEIINLIDNNNQIVFWKVKFPERIIPQKKLFDNKIIALNHFSMIGFMYHKIHDNKADFDYFSGGDFHFISQLAPKIPTSLWVDKVYTGIQRKHEMGGFGRKDDLR
jgi:glycosyltransferase involved in cell wall biosynthesis